MRSEAGEEIVLEKNVFVERILLNDSANGFTEEEKAEYIRPFKNAGEDRRPTLTWPRQIPIEGDPIEVVEEVGTKLPGPASFTFGNKNFTSEFLLIPKEIILRRKRQIPAKPGLH